MLKRLKTLGAVTLAVLAFAAIAGDLYKWQDKEGVWHFSSTPPTNDEKYETLAMPVDPQPFIRMRKLGTEHEPEYAFFNQLWGPVEIEIKLTDAENVTTQPPVPARFVLQGQTEKRLLKAGPTDPTRGFHFKLTYRSMIGPPLAAVPAAVDYYPPFPLGRTFIISQGFDDDTTHHDAANQYAVDIAMPVGTPVLAARSGKVMDVQDNFHGAGRQKRFLPRANEIRILHDDGTMAVYAHLEANSLRVRPGGQVKRGQWIANSGNTGYSNGPHLHFAVQMNAGMSLESMPFNFKKPNGGSMTPSHQMPIEGVLPRS
ncbi:MAG: M23 family metallopeptidase [Lysobacterales bacterium]|jgi:murein DD-endopeptidase MepM/ murein hydrolase activator NlpD